MATKKTSVSGAKVTGRKGSTKKAQTGAKVQSESINVSAVAGLVENVCGGSGVGSGASAPSVSSLTSPAVGGGVVSSKGRANSADQLETAVSLAVADENEKEERLYKKLVRPFLAPEFDKNAFAAGMIAAGKNFTEILSAVTDAKKEFEKNNPAPSCDAAKVLAVAGSDFATEFKNLVGCLPSDINPAAVRVFSRPAGVLVSRPLPSDATAAAVVRAVLSWRWYVKEQHETAARAAARRSDYRSSLLTAARNGLDLGYTEERIIQEFTLTLRRAKEQIDGETALLRKNYLKYRRLVDEITAKIAVLCPSVVVARLGDNRGTENVFVLPENITKEQKAVCGCEFAKLRNYRRNLTAINAKLFGADVVL